MTQDKDKIQQAADALEALGADAAPAGPTGGPSPEAPVSETPTPEAPTQPPASPKLTPPAKSSLNRKIALRRALIPILLSTALVMVLLGVWSVVVLVGGSDPFKGEVTSQTRYLARLMLLAWPIAVILLAGTAFLMHEVYSHYRIHQPPQPAAEPKRD